MEKCSFILRETFQSQSDEQRRERFQKEFERYIIGLMDGVSLENPLE